MCQPRARFPRGVSCTLAHSGTLATFNASLTSTPTKERKPISFQNTPTPAGPGASPAMAAHPKLRSAGIMAYFTTSSKPELQPQQCLGKAKALEHEYPIQFITALANSMQRIAEVCPCFLVVEPVPLVLLIVTDWSLLAGMSEYRSRIRATATAQRQAFPVADVGRAWQAPAALTQDQRDACAAACSQAEEWNNLASDYLHTSQVCVNTMLQVLFDDVACVPSSPLHRPT